MLPRKLFSTRNRYKFLALKAMDQFYKQAGIILTCLARRDGSVKTMTIGNSRVKPEWKRKMYALICETLKYSEVLVEIIEKTKILNESSKVDVNAALPLVHDILLARGGLQHIGGSRGGKSEAVKLILGAKTQLRAVLAEIMEKKGVRAKKELIPLHLRDENQIPRYVRVNLIKSTKEKIVAAFQEEGYRLLPSNQKSDPRPLSLTPKSRAFALDPHLSDLLVFPPGTDFHAHPLYLDGSIILQDKASCFPAHVVSPSLGSKALDACAAPGNKTSHMSSLMNNTGTIFAFDMDQRRLELLQTLTGKAGCTNIISTCHNFLEVNPADPKYKDVEYFLLDPSCSGSGILNRMDTLVDHFATCVGHESKVDTSSKSKRLQNLADFQVKIIIHAMKFPSAKRISYSTCSVHQEENEDVVSRVLQFQKRFVVAPRDQVLAEWPRRGLETTGLTKEQSEALVRASPEDGVNGFFVACFVVDPSAPPIPINSNIITDNDGEERKEKGVHSKSDISVKNQTIQDDDDNSDKKGKEQKRQLDSASTSEATSKRRKKSRKRRPKQVTV